MQFEIHILQILITATRCTTEANTAVNIRQGSSTRQKDRSQLSTSTTIRPTVADMADMDTDTQALTLRSAQ